MKFRRFFPALVAGAMLLTGCQFGDAAQKTQTTAPPEPVVKELVTLGDSISYGYGLQNPETERYSALLTKALSEKDDVIWKDYNYAVSGDRSTDLLNILKNNTAEKLPDADAVVICIGGNNLLRPFTDFLKHTAENIQNRITEIKGLKKDSITDYSITDLGKLGGILVNGITNINYDALQTDIDAGMNTLKSDLEEIYMLLREKNSKADIYVMNVYNPYKNLTDVKLPGMSEPVNLYGQARLDVVNGIIADWEAAHSDLIAVDLSGEYAKLAVPPIIGKLNLEKAMEADSPAVSAAPAETTAPAQTSVPAGTAPSASSLAAALGIPEGILIDPHPTAEGQRIIADLLLRTMRPVSS